MCIGVVSSGLAVLQLVLYIGLLCGKYKKTGHTLYKSAAWVATGFLCVRLLETLLWYDRRTSDDEDPIENSDRVYPHDLDRIKYTFTNAYETCSKWNRMTTSLLPLTFIIQMMISLRHGHHPGLKSSMTWLYCCSFVICLVLISYWGLCTAVKTSGVPLLQSLGVQQLVWHFPFESRFFESLLSYILYLLVWYPLQDETRTDYHRWLVLTFLKCCVLLLSWYYVDVFSSLFCLWHQFTVFVEIIKLTLVSASHHLMVSNHAL